MPRKSNKLARNYLDGYLNELAHTWYEQDEAKAFRHAAFQTLVPDPTLSDAQVIEMTAIDQSGDLEVDGWFVDEDAETVFLFQAAGGTSKVNEGKVVKFWEAPHELLNAERVRNSTNQLVKELSTELDSKLNQEYSITMVFAAKGGFVPSARAFASSRKNEDRSFTSLIDKDLSSRCSFQLFDYNDVANTFYSFRVALTEPQTNVVLAINRDWTYVVDKTGPQSIRATVAASELVRVFKENGYKLFTLNPRGPIATAKVNGNIRKTLDTTVGRTNFHLLNNGMCATCEGFDLDKKNGALSITNFQIVNGCQTTFTLSKRSEKELKQTHVDLKLVIADRIMAEEIAQASNSQTALRARDYTSFDDKQRQLQRDFESLQPPWYYEIKQGYWNHVLDDKQKALFKTGKKRHIEVQPLAQASLAFLGDPSTALDRIRYVFQGIRSSEDRVWYEKAFPPEATVEQLILPWKCSLNVSVLKKTASIGSSNFHILWLIAELLRRHYKSTNIKFFTPDLSLRLADSIDDWFHIIYKIADSACALAFNRAAFITGDKMQLEVRDFFRGTRNYGGAFANDLILEACDQVLKFTPIVMEDLKKQLPP